MDTTYLVIGVLLLIAAVIGGLWDAQRTRRKALARIEQARAEREGRQLDPYIVADRNRLHHKQAQEMNYRHALARRQQNTREAQTGDITVGTALGSTNLLNPLHPLNLGSTQGITNPALNPAPECAPSQPSSNSSESPSSSCSSSSSDSGSSSGGTD